MKLDDLKIAVIGLGYVGLPLAVEFGKKFSTVGFDINRKRIDELRSGNDFTLEVNSEDLGKATHLIYTTEIESIKDCNFYIVTVPTPIDDNNAPDLKPLESASQSVAKVIQKGDIVVYVSTVYPGATEEVCITKKEKIFKMKLSS